MCPRPLGTPPPPPTHLHRLSVNRPLRRWLFPTRILPTQPPAVGGTYPLPPPLTRISCKPKQRLHRIFAKVWKKSISENSNQNPGCVPYTPSNRVKNTQRGSKTQIDHCFLHFGGPAPMASLPHNQPNPNPQQNTNAHRCSSSEWGDFQVSLNR